jgi:hypothetical protein
VARALLDGPSLLLIAGGVALVESGRPWLGAALLGVCGLGRETNVLGAAALAPPRSREARVWASWLAKGLLVLLPLVLWMLCLRVWLGRGDNLGDARNFAPPFCALAEKMQQSVSQLLAEGYPSLAKFDLLVVAGLLAQFFFFVCRHRWGDPWWRVGAVYAVLMIFLGDAVWENYPSAAARVLLPMTLAFNILVPRGRWWTLLLIVGNLGVFASSDIFKPPGRESYVVAGPNALRINPKDGSSVEAIYVGHNWWHPEKSRWEFWRWSMGDAPIVIRNPQPFTLLAHLKFRVRSADERQAIVTEEGRVLWQSLLAPKQSVRVRIGELDLPPGDTVLLFKSDRAAAFPGNNDPRRLSFSVRDFEIDVDRRK